MDIRSILQDHGIEDSPKVQFTADVDRLEQQLTDLDQYIENAFRDGVIQESEAKKIRMYLNLVDESKKKVDERYKILYYHEALQEGAVKAELFAAYGDFIIKHNTLMADIQLAISDGIATAEESETVNNGYVNLSNAIVRMEKAFEMANDAIIQRKTNVAEQNAIDHANTVKEDLEKVTDALDDRLLDTEGYIDGAFRDGIITELEAATIKSYLETLNTRKAELDSKYKEIFNNYFLSGIPKTNLQSAKQNYDREHAELIKMIEDAIEDGKATPEEAVNIRQQFVEMDTVLAQLITAFEKAIAAFTEARADEAERLAKEGANEYTDREVGILDEILKTIAADNILSKPERIKIKDEVVKIIGRIIGDYDDMPTIASIDASEKGEVYAVRAEARSVGLEVTHQDYVAFEAAYNNLSAYLNQIEPKPWDVTSEDTVEVDKVEWRTKWLDYYAYVGIIKVRIAQLLDQKNTEITTRVEKNSADILLHDTAIKLRVTSEIYEEGITRIHKVIEDVKDDVTYKVEIISTRGLAFRSGVIDTTLIAKVYKGAEDVTDTMAVQRFKWSRVSDDEAGDRSWNDRHAGGTKTITIGPSDVRVRATFNCELLDEK